MHSRLRTLDFPHAYSVADSYQTTFKIYGSSIYKSISTMENRAPRACKLQRLKASRGNGTNKFRSVRSFRGELSAVARAHTRDAFVLRQEMSMKTRGWRNFIFTIKQNKQNTFLCSP